VSAGYLYRTPWTVERTSLRSSRGARRAPAL